MSTDTAAVPASPEASANPPSAARVPVLTEWIGLFAFFGLMGALAWRVVDLSVATDWIWVGAAVLLGYVLSDFISGLVHWLFDTWGSATTPVVGKTFVVPFRTHHSDPKDITLHGFVATNGHNCLSSLPALGAALFFPTDAVWTPAAMAFVFSLCLGIFATNQFHKWAHEDSPHAVIALAQKLGLILGREHHQIHHAAPYDTHYCITTGWLNRPLRAVGFYRGLERIITRVTGVQPRVDDLKGS